MKPSVQHSAFSIQKPKYRLSRLLFTIHCSLLTVFLLFTAAFAADWSGVDESVVEKYAKDHGREAHAPLINTDQGDLLLFMFLIGGVIGGFAAGYYWRTLMEDRIKTAAHGKGKVSGNM